MRPGKVDSCFESDTGRQLFITTENLGKKGKLEL